MRHGTHSLRNFVCFALKVSSFLNHPSLCAENFLKRVIEFTLYHQRGAILYSLVSNRRGGWNSRGGWKKSQKLIAGGVGIIGGVGKNLSDSHFLYIVTVRL